jgi:hypothetical protein
VEDGEGGMILCEMLLLLLLMMIMMTMTMMPMQLSTKPTLVDLLWSLQCQQKQALPLPPTTTTMMPRMTVQRYPNIQDQDPALPMMLPLMAMQLRPKRMPLHHSGRCHRQQRHRQHINLQRYEQQKHARYDITVLFLLMLIMALMMLILPMMLILMLIITLLLLLLVMMPMTMMLMQLSTKPTLVDLLWSLQCQQTQALLLPPQLTLGQLEQKSAHQAPLYHAQSTMQLGLDDHRRKQRHNCQTQDWFQGDYHHHYYRYR